MNYPEIGGAFAHVYLEDSFVLTISVTPGRVVFGAEFVLLPEHELYSAPGDGERYYYRRGSLVFSSVKGVVWLGQGAPASVDPFDGSEDFGNIDSLRVEGSTYSLEGDWGEMQIVSPLLPAITFDLVKA